MKDRSNTSQVEEVIKGWDEALYHKDIERLTTFYATESITFDVGDQVTGRKSIQSLWEPCLPFFGEHIGIERKEESLTVTESMALFTSYNRLLGMEADVDAAKSWLRSTVVFQKIDDEWKITHEHVSFPCDCENEKPAYILD